MKKTLTALVFATGLVIMTGCGSKEKKTDPEMEKATIEMENVSDSLESTLDHIKELETDLESALEDL